MIDCTISLLNKAQHNYTATPGKEQELKYFHK